MSEGPVEWTQKSRGKKYPRDTQEELSSERKLRRRVEKI
jgi:hypothetical protein